MNILTIWQRLLSENPKFFKYIQILAAIVLSLAQALLWIDNSVDITWVNTGVRALFDDIVKSGITAFIMAQLTTNNQTLSEK